LQGGPDLSAYAKTASLADVASTGAYADLIGAPDTSVFAKAADLAAVATSGNYADLTGAPTLAKLDATCGTGLVIKGLKADGSYECVQAMDPTGLPADAIDEVSNGLIWNQFTDVFSSAAALPIPDNNPIGGFSEIVVGDVGLAQKLTVSVELANSDISAVQVSLYDSANQEYVLYNKGGKKGDGIKTSYPDPTKTVSGDLTYWVGKNPKGTWRLKIIDTAFLNNTTDGQVVKWSVNLQTLSSKKIQIKGDLIVDGATYIKGDLKVDGKVTTVDSTTVKPVVYRWINFSTYANNHGDWFMSNRTDVYGGVNPSTWTDGNACASNISSSREVQRSFFTRKGYGGYNANVWTEEWKSYSSTNSHKAAVLFRIKNTTANAITWNVYTFMTAWVDEDRASVSVNGANTWCPGSNYYANDANNFSLSIPGNRTSTVIFVAGSTPQWNDLRACILAFWNNSLALPAGLEYVDDLDTAKDGWEQ
jgi:subtilisin-like proprotein convertase family protein